MKPFYFSGLILICTMFTSNAQEKLPYYEIPEAPEEFTAGSVVSRMIDGLGFRYYWATEGLRTEDLLFKPSEEARTSLETIEHIHGLINVILNAVTEQANTGEKLPEMSFPELRKKTLVKLQKASAVLRNSTDISRFKIIFKRDNVSGAWSTIKLNKAFVSHKQLIFFCCMHFLKSSKSRIDCGYITNS